MKTSLRLFIKTKLGHNIKKRGLMIKYCVWQRYKNLFDFGHNKFRFRRPRPVKVIKNAAKTSSIYSFENYRNISSIRFKQSKKKIMWYHKLYCIDLFTLVVVGLFLRSFALPLSYSAAFKQTIQIQSPNPSAHIYFITIIVLVFGTHQFP